MRVAYVSPRPPEASGIADYAEHLARALEGAGVSVTTGLPSPLEAPDPAAVRRHARHLAALPVDLYHFELGGGRVRHFLVLRELLALRPGRPVTATVHDPERLAWRAWGLGRFEALPRPLQQAATLAADPLSRRRERAVAHALDRLVVLTEGGAEGLRRWMRLPPERIEVIPHGVAEVPHREPPPAPPLRVLFFGFLYPGKGIEDLLDALDWVRRERPAQFPRLRLTLAGGSRPSMLLRGRGDYVAHLRAEIARRGLEERVDWALDLPEAEIPRLYQDHHLLALPYRDSRKIGLLGRFLGSSGALSWAIACGRGALVSDARALAGEVARGNGAVFPQRDPAALGARLAELAAAPETAFAWAAHAARLARERTWARVAGRFVQVFRSTLEKRGKAA